MNKFKYVGMMSVALFAIGSGSAFANDLSNISSVKNITQSVVGVATGTTSVTQVVEEGVNGLSAAAVTAIKAKIAELTPLWNAQTKLSTAAQQIAIDCVNANGRANCTSEIAAFEVVAAPARAYRDEIYALQDSMNPAMNPVVNISGNMPSYTHQQISSSGGSPSTTSNSSASSGSGGGWRTQ